MILPLTGLTEVLFANGKQTQWLDYLPSPVVALVATTAFCAVAMQDGSVNVYSHTGRRYVSVRESCLVFVVTTAFQINADANHRLALFLPLRLQTLPYASHNFRTSLCLVDHCFLRAG